MDSEVENQRADTSGKKLEGHEQTVAKLDAALSVLQQEVIELKQSHKHEIRMLQTEAQQHIRELDSAETACEEMEQENCRLQARLDDIPQQRLDGFTSRAAVVALRAGALAAKRAGILEGSALVSKEKSRLEEAASVLGEELKLVTAEKEAQKQQQNRIEHQQSAMDQSKV